jgi:hypothetical protein
LRGDGKSSEVEEFKGREEFHHRGHRESGEKEAQKKPALKNEDEAHEESSAAKAKRCRSWSPDHLKRGAPIP